MKERSIGRIVGRVFLVLLTTVLLLALAVVGVVFVVLRGPSPAAQELLTRSLKETSAIGFIPDLFLSPARVNEIMSFKEEETEITEETDTSLVTISARRNPEDPDPETDAAADPKKDNLILDEDGIQLYGVTGANYSGMMMVVDDPFRVFVGTPDSYGYMGLTLEQMITKYDAIAGINGGGFYDPGGSGNGGVPDGIVITNGTMAYGYAATVSSVIGIDADGILHVGRMSAQDALNRNIQWACSFGPALIVNGEPQSGAEITSSSVNPRTAIGQRSDGAILMLVVDGRQVTSLGATFEDLISIFLDFGAVNASNLDGGSSTQLIYGGQTMNLNSSVIGLRPLPTAFLVRR